MDCQSMICPKSALSIQKQLMPPVRPAFLPSIQSNSETLKTNNDNFVNSIEDLNRLIKDFSEQSSKLSPAWNGINAVGGCYPEITISSEPEVCGTGSKGVYQAT